ncbi:hypothetical protein SOCEGT47_015180 [Sorangium cellulosum]|uniref:Zinc finger/thioredoxin putative domain-containing protein n=1 Tax=Sorangium cellulosum TaxID=56 RepID=A0A4P2PWG7_SORCE|nr:GYF domain-containing protein [Sorangium cellulosum]AUX21040.1 hypothetical protein SOCEGT47_015180 [Sorangium cellulosum]
MKFICDNCKAKYQIGDDKVAGKMVRMKCRRCGHLIQVSASVTESSVAKALPVEPPRAASDDAHLVLSGDEAAAPAAAPAVEARSTGVAKLAAKAPAPAALGHGGAPTPPRPAAQPLARPGGAPRPAVAPRATPGAAARPAAGPRPAPAPQDPPSIRASQPSSGVPAIPVAPAARAPEPAPPTDVASAFNRSMSGDRPLGKAPAVRATSGEDWYVGVGGVPLGPVRLAVIREKALAGAVDGDSLVWREGFDEWLPLKNFPELLEIVTQAQSTRLSAPARRISTSFSAAQVQVPPSTRVPASTRIPPLAASAPARPGRIEPEPPGVSDPPPAVSGPVAAFSAGTPASAPLSAGAPALAPRSASAPRVTPVTAAAVSAPAAWPDAAGGAARARAEGAAPVEVLSDPFATRPSTAVDPSPPPEPAPPATASVARAAGGLAAASPPQTTSTVGLSSAEPAPLVATRASLVETVAPRRRSGMSPVAYAFIAMAAAFGGVSAYVLLSPKPQPVQVPTIPQSQPALLPTAAPPPPPSAEPEPETPPPAETATAKPEAASPVKPGGAVPQRSQPEKPAASASNPAPFDRSGFGAGVPGPSSGPGHQGSGSGLGQLSQGEIAGVVEANRPGVRRHCWQPALDARARNAPSTARVTAAVVISPSGAVQSATASGSEKDYPGLSSCIASRVRSWKFPPSSGSMTVNIPFVFAAQ